MPNAGQMRNIKISKIAPVCIGVCVCVCVCVKCYNKFTLKYVSGSTWALTECTHRAVRRLRIAEGCSLKIRRTARYLRAAVAGGRFSGCVTAK
jgi:hypothetical protein